MVYAERLWSTAKLFGDLDDRPILQHDLADLSASKQWRTTVYNRIRSNLLGIFDRLWINLCFQLNIVFAIFVVRRIMAKHTFAMS